MKNKNFFEIVFYFRNKSIEWDSIFNRAFYSRWVSIGKTFTEN